jgi:hypothetical protein
MFKRDVYYCFSIAKSQQLNKLLLLKDFIMGYIQEFSGHRYGKSCICGRGPKLNHGKCYQCMNDILTDIQYRKIQNRNNKKG